MVAVPDVVLHVERALRGAGEKDTCRERITAVGQRVNPGLAGVRGQPGRDPQGRAVSRPCP